jgi:hypothetical protein
MAMRAHLGKEVLDEVVGDLVHVGVRRGLAEDRLAGPFLLLALLSGRRGRRRRARRRRRGCGARGDLDHKLQLCRTSTTSDQSSEQVGE